MAPLCFRHCLYMFSCMIFWALFIYFLLSIRTQIETGASIVTGTRYVKGGGEFGRNLMRKLTSRGANMLAQTFLWPGVSDLTGSFR